MCFINCCVLGFAAVFHKLLCFRVCWFHKLSSVLGFAGVFHKLLCFRVCCCVS